MTVLVLVAVRVPVEGRAPTYRVMWCRSHQDVGGKRSPRHLRKSVCVVGDADEVLIPRGSHSIVWRVGVGEQHRARGPGGPGC